MKTEVYTWRLSADRKTALEEEAGARGTSLSMLLDRVTADWLAQRRNGHSDEDGEQAEIRNRARAAIGSIQGDNSTRSERTSELVAKSSPSNTKRSPVPLHEGSARHPGGQPVRLPVRSIPVPFLLSLIATTSGTYLASKRTTTTACRG